MPEEKKCHYCAMMIPKEAKDLPALQKKNANFRHDWISYYNNLHCDNSMGTLLGNTLYAKNTASRERSPNCHR